MYYNALVLIYFSYTTYSALDINFANWWKLIITFKHHFATLKPVISQIQPCWTSFFLCCCFQANYWFLEFRLVINISWWQTVTAANSRQPVNECFQIHPNMAVNLWVTVLWGTAGCQAIFTQVHQQDAEALSGLGTLPLQMQYMGMFCLHQQ